MIEFRQHFQDLPSDAVFAFDRLIGIGIGAERDRHRHVMGIRKFGAQEIRRIGLGEQLALEIEAG